MKRFLGKYQLALAVLAASIIGSVTTVAVFAAIPSTQGIINGCRGKMSGQLRVIDSRANCGFGQESLRWDKGVVAYALFVPDYVNGVYKISTGKSYNISVVPTIHPNAGTCLEFEGTIEKNIRFLTKGGADMDRWVMLRTDSNDAKSNIDYACGPDADAVIDTLGSDFYLAAF